MMLIQIGMILSAYLNPFLPKLIWAALGLFVSDLKRNPVSPMGKIGELIERLSENIGISEGRRAN